MEKCWDFLEWLGPDASTTVLTLLDDPADLVRVGAVSRSWRRFVIVNGFSKRLCSRIFTEVSNFSYVIGASNGSKNAEVGSSTALEWENLEREHLAYAFLCHSIASPVGKRDCIYGAVCASSTDNYPDESIENTLVPSESVVGRPSYWSSGGQTDPGVPETLTYRLIANLCVVNEIKIQPFRASFQNDNPIYSAKFVRFRMGARLRQGTGTFLTDGFEEQQSASDDKYNWTYVSPEFPMAQENVLQSFKLPHPVVCIGGMLQIELMGRVQKQAVDDLYYICVCHVQVIGSPLSPVFDVDILEAPGSLVLKYSPGSKGGASPKGNVEAKAEVISPWHSVRARLMNLEAGMGWDQPVLASLLRPILTSDDEGEAYDDGSDDDYFHE